LHTASAGAGAVVVGSLNTDFGYIGVVAIGFAGADAVDSKRNNQAECIVL